MLFEGVGWVYLFFGFEFWMRCEIFVVVDVGSFVGIWVCLFLIECLFWRLRMGFWFGKC